MRVTDRLVFHRAQTETLRGVVGRLLEAAIVEAERLGLAVFEEQFAVIRAFEAAGDDGRNFLAVETGAVDQGRWGLCHVLPLAVQR